MSRLPKLILCGFVTLQFVNAQITAVGANGATAMVYPNGTWSVTVPGPGWTFSGSLGSAALAAHNINGRDALGSYQEVAFNYSAGASSRTASIRMYTTRPAAVFSVTYNNQ